MTINIRILGCGSSGGVPVVGLGWGACDPDNSKNRRLRPSVLVSTQGINILIDATPDLREQLLTARIDHIDALLMTHTHADHLHGIDDLRRANLKREIDLYTNQDTLRVIKQRFGYLMASSNQEEKTSQSYYKPFLMPHTVDTTDDITDGIFSIKGPKGEEVTVKAFAQDHGYSTTLGFRIGDFAYSSDVVGLDERAFDHLAGIQVWVVDCLRTTPHPTHAHLEKTLNWISHIQPRQAILTHMSHETDYQTLLNLCPSGVEPAYDGMEITVG